MAIGGVINGQPVDAPTTNGAFLKRNGDDAAQGIIALASGDTASGSTVTNAQGELNSLASFTGKALNAGKSALPAFSNNQGLSANDSLATRADALSAKFHGSTGHAHTGAPGDGAKITFTSIGGTQLIGYAVRGADLTVTGNSSNVTTNLAGKAPSTGDAVKGVVVSAGNNYVHLLDQYGDSILDSQGNRVYGRLTYNSSTWNISFYSLAAGVETAFSFGSSTLVEWYYQQLFDETDRPVYSDLFVLQSDQVAGQVPSGSFTVAGKVLLGGAGDVQPVGTANSKGSTTGKAAAADHAHQGVHSVNGGGAALYGDVTFKAVNATVSQDATSITITVPPAVASNLSGVLTSGNSAGSSNIDMNGQSVLNQGFSESNIVTTPANPATGKVRFYVKSDGFLYKLTSAGVESVVNFVTPALSDVLGKGNSTGVYGIDMSTNPIYRAGFLEFNLAAGCLTPGLGQTRIYANNDGKIYRVKSDGTQTELGAGGGGGSSVVWFQGDSANVPEIYSQALSLLEFTDTDQNIWAELVVPESYTVGTQVKILGGKVGTSVSSGNIQMRTDAFLIGSGFILGNLGTLYTSSNAQLSVATANQLYAIGTLDLTDTAGKIGGVAVQPLDTLLIRLYRNTQAETTSAAAPALVVKNSFVPKFTA